MLFIADMLVYCRKPAAAGVAVNAQSGGGLHARGDDGLPEASA